MSKYNSGRVKRFDQTGITSDRYEFLGLEQAEPDLGDPVVGVSSVGVKPAPAGSLNDQYVLTAIATETGSRYWIKSTDLFVQGIQGTQGTQGLQGQQGTQGTQGLQGTQGTQGLQGTQGSQGLQGLQGTQGLSNQGDQGVQGTQGLQGRQGTQGLSNQGVQGTQGTQGLQGTQGTQGLSNQGVQGTSNAGTITVNNTTNSTYYPTFATASSGSFTPTISSNKLIWNPSYGSIGIGYKNFSDLNLNTNFAKVGIAHSFYDNQYNNPTVHIDNDQNKDGSITLYTDSTYSSLRVGLKIDVSYNAETITNPNNKTFWFFPLADWKNNNIELVKSSGDYQPGSVLRGNIYDPRLVNTSSNILYNGYSSVWINTSSSPLSVQTTGFNPAADYLKHGIINDNTIITGASYSPYQAREFGAGGVGRIGFCYITYGGDVVIRFNGEGGNYYPSAEEVGSAMAAPGRVRQVIMDSPVGTSYNAGTANDANVFIEFLPNDVYTGLGGTDFQGAALKDANRQTIGKVMKVVGNIDSKSGTSGFFCLTEYGYVWATTQHNTYGWLNTGNTTDLEQPCIVWDIASYDSLDRFTGNNNVSVQTVEQTKTGASVGIKTTRITGINTDSLYVGQQVFMDVGTTPRVFGYNTVISTVGITSVTINRASINTTALSGVGVSFGIYSGTNVERRVINITSTHDMADDSDNTGGVVYCKIGQYTDLYNELWTTGGYNASGQLGVNNTTSVSYAQPCCFQQNISGVTTSGTYIQSNNGYQTGIAGTFMTLTISPPNWGVSSGIGTTEPGYYLGEFIAVDFTSGTSVDSLYEVIDKVGPNASGITTYDVRRHTGKNARAMTSLNTSGNFNIIGRSRLLKKLGRTIWGQWSGGGNSGMCYLQDSSRAIWFVGENASGSAGDGTTTDKTVFTDISTSSPLEYGGSLLPNNREILKLVIAGTDGFADTFMMLGDVLGAASDWELWHSGRNTSGYGYGNTTQKNDWRVIAGSGSTMTNGPLGPIYNFWIRDRSSGGVASGDTLYVMNGLSTLYCCGNNTYYQLANGTTTSSTSWTIPTKFPANWGAPGSVLTSDWLVEQMWPTSQAGSTGNGFIALFRHTQTNEYRLYAWGYNASGLLGLDAAAAPTTPKRLNLGIPAYKIKDIRVFARDTSYDGIGLMITYDGEIYGVGGARYNAGGAPVSYPLSSFWAGQEFGTSGGGRYFYSWTKINPLNQL